MPSFTSHAGLTSVYAFVPDTLPWLFVADLPVPMESAIALPSDELMVVDRKTGIVYKASLLGTLYIHLYYRGFMYRIVGNFRQGKFSNYFVSSVKCRKFSCWNISCRKYSNLEYQHICMSLLHCFSAKPTRSYWSALIELLSSSVEEANAAVTAVCKRG